MDCNTITLDNGYKLDASKPLHIRQGYTMTSQASQGHEHPKMFAFLPVSATSQINAVQMLVRSQPIYGNGGHDNYGRGEKVSERKVNEIGVLYVASSCAGLGYCA